MSEAKFTPGPWQASLCDDGLWMVHTEGEIVCHSDANTRGDPVNEVNARLIASAPDLLEALQAILPFIPKTSASEGGASTFSENVRAADKVRAAISKATGE